MDKTFQLIFFIVCASLLNFVSSQTQSEIEKGQDNVQNLEFQRIRKKISVGDEFPALSIGLLNNSTEYEIHLNTSNHKCENRYKCDMYIYLTDMICTKSASGTNSPYLEIEGLTSTNQTVCEKWCRDKSSLRTENTDEAAEFIPARRALIKPMGDWTNTNATISILALFAEQQPLETTILTKETPSVVVKITNSSSPHNFFYDDRNDDSQRKMGNVSLGLRLHMICTGEKGRNSTDLQVIAILKNNQTSTINVCADSELNQNDNDNANESHSFNVSGFLTNIQQVYLTPVGEWENAKTVAHILVDSVFDISGESGNCPPSYFDCGQIRGCEEEQSEDKSDDNASVMSSVSGSEDENDIHFKNFMTDPSSPSPCVPINWVTNENGVDTCNLIRKYCPKNNHEENLDSQGRWAIIFKRCVFYYAFFIIPVLTMLIMVFGTAYYIKMRQLKDAMKENECEQNNSVYQRTTNGKREQSRSPYFSIFHKFRKDVSYHTLEDVTF